MGASINRICCSFFNCTAILRHKSSKNTPSKQQTSHTKTVRGSSNHFLKSPEKQKQEPRMLKRGSCKFVWVVYIPLFHLNHFTSCQKECSCAINLPAIFRKVLSGISSNWLYPANTAFFVDTFVQCNPAFSYSRTKLLCI